MRRLILITSLMLAAPLALLSSAPVLAQGAAGFPSKPIKIIVPFNAGSGSDSMSRYYGEVLGKMLGQTFVVENRPGGSGLLAIGMVKQAPADGYTILLASVSPMAVNPVVMKNLPYDPFKDFRPVHGISVGPAAFVVRGDSPYKTINDLVAGMKKANRPMSVGNYSLGYQLIGAWLGTAGGVPVTHVPYKGGAQMVTDVLGGQLDVAVNDFSGVAPLIKDGRLRALAITSDKRVPNFTDIPTMKESGFAEFETYVWASFFVRAETPDDIVAKLAESMNKAMNSEEGKAHHAYPSVERITANAWPLSGFARSLYLYLKKAAEAAGIKPE